MVGWSGDAAPAAWMCTARPGRQGFEDDCRTIDARRQSADDKNQPEGAKAAPAEAKVGTAVATERRVGRDDAATVHARRAKHSTTDYSTLPDE